MMAAGHGPEMNVPEPDPGIGMYTSPSLSADDISYERDLDRKRAMRQRQYMQHEQASRRSQYPAGYEAALAEQQRNMYAQAQQQREMMMDGGRRQNYGGFGQQQAGYMRDNAMG